MKKKFAFQFSKFFMILFIAFLSSCNNKPKTENEKVMELLLSKNELKITNETKNICILTENSCIACNRAFSSYLKKEIDNKSTILIVNASGQMVDISHFQEIKSDNVFLHKFHDSFFNKSRLIKLTNKKIDTIIDINVDTIETIVSKPSL